MEETLNSFSSDKDNLSKELSDAELELSKKEPELQALDESFSKPVSYTHLTLPTKA